MASDVVGWNAKPLTASSSVEEFRNAGFAPRYGSIIAKMPKEYRESDRFWKIPFWRTMAISIVAYSILFVENQLTTLLVGFFPSHAAQTFELSQWHISAVFSIYPLCIMFSSPLAAKLSCILGRQTVISMGLLLSGLTTLLFAHATTPFCILLLRALQGIGAGAAGTFSFDSIHKSSDRNDTDDCRLL